MRTCCRHKRPYSSITPIDKHTSSKLSAVVRSISSERIWFYRDFCQKADNTWLYSVIVAVVVVVHCRQSSNKTQQQSGHKTICSHIETTRRIKYIELLKRALILKSKTNKNQNTHANCSISDPVSFPLHSPSYAICLSTRPNDLAPAFSRPFIPTKPTNSILNPVHTSNDVEATSSNAKSRMLLRQCCRFWQQYRINVRLCYQKPQQCQTSFS